jgi:hypothetical protein
MRQRIFVGSSRETIDVCRAVQRELDQDFYVKVWDQDVFRPTRSALDSLLAELDSSDAGIFVVRGDDMTTKRGESDSTVRDNVIFELGLYIGRLGQDRAFMLSPRGDRPRMPSDLAGLTTLDYDPVRFRADKRAAVAPACDTIRDELGKLQAPVAQDSPLRRRLDRAMKRMSRDLESLFSAPAPQTRNGDDARPLADVPISIGRATVRIEVGRIQDHEPDDDCTVVALPANEYFDSECVKDVQSSLGAFVDHHLQDDLDLVLSQIEAELDGKPSERVPRTESRIEDSYGIGQAIYLRGLAPQHRVILVSATTDRAGIGLRAEPHFLYAAIQGVVEAMNENRLTGLVMPVFGSGHGVMPLTVALLFNLLALRSTLADDIGDRVRDVRIVVFERKAGDVAEGALREVVSRVATR